MCCKRSSTARRIRPARLRWPGLLAALLLATAPAAHPQADFSGLLSEIAPAVVRVEAAGAGSGSGFVVQRALPDGGQALAIVTACHVVVQAPRPVQAAAGLPVVQVTFGAWAPEVTLQAAVTRCDPARDVAVLAPLDADGEPIALADALRALAAERGDARLQRVPFLWLGRSAEPAPLEPAIFMGYPGPFSEFSATSGRIGARLPVAYVGAEDGWVGAVSAVLIYEGPADGAVSPDRILYFDSPVAMGLAALAALADRVRVSGHQLIVFGQNVSPLDVRAWDVVSVEDGTVQLREREISLDTALGYDLELFAPKEARATLAFEREFFKVDAPVGPGYSGGPVLNLSGQVIGMVQWEVGGLEGANYAATAADIASVLEAP